MQRITRLVSGPPSRGRWGTRAGIAVLVAAGAVLAVQAGITGHMRPGLRIRSTTDGVLGPGDMREISAHGIDGDRFYRADVDANGRLAEVYKRDGQVRPLDADARRWLAEVLRLSVPPAPPMPPPPPAFADIPPPPEPPSITDAAVFKTLLRRVVADPTVVARLGTPVAMASTDVGGRLDFDGDADPDGSADLTFDLSGPKGRATVRVDGDLSNGVWSIEPIRFVAPGR